MTRRALFFALACAMLFGCRPDLGDRESLVTRTQILAVRGEPPEAQVGQSVRYSLLVATPEGPVDAPVTSWAFCATPKLLTENGAASATCLRDGVRPLADGPPALDALIPTDACALFGPEVVSADLRPRDPDVTGGYYQPLRVRVFGPSLANEGPTVAFGMERLDCNLANAPADVTTAFAKRHVPNANPGLEALAIRLAGATVPSDGIPRGSTVTLRASWPAASAETYVVYDQSSRTPVTHKETMRVSWFATAGAFSSDRTGRSEDELETFTENDWTAPSEARTTHVFVVLRDARGGIAFSTHELVTR